MKRDQRRGVTWAGHRRKTRPAIIGKGLNSIRAHESVLEAHIPYMLPSTPFDRFAMSIVLTLLSLFPAGVLRALIANIRWWRAGLEMFGLGAFVAAVAYGSGAVVAALID